MDLKEVEKVVTQIQRRLFKEANSYSIGMLKSHFRGSGLQFKEHQVYCHGDDVRFIDWKLYARSRTPYVKTFEEERNVEIIIFIDLSLSMLIGFRKTTKLEAAINIASLISLLAKETNDSVQVILLADEEKILKKSNGKKTIVHLIGELRKIDIIKDSGRVNIAYRPQKTMESERKFNIINRFLRQKKEVVVLSDFSDFWNRDKLDQLSQNRRAHFFRIISPIDQLKSFKFSTYGLDASKFPSTKGKMIRSGSRKYHSEMKWPLGIKTIDIERKYMEDFVRELV
ncbi:MAG: DUF58 domain-containing protein [Bacteriovoracales bacterium]|nr:DUF58 domain-containing protein [Bacteriovoracales bacterium]